MFKTIIKKIKSKFEHIENVRISKDLEKRKNEIAKQRYEQIVNKLQAYVIADVLCKDGLLLTNKESRKRAVSMFLKAKEDGLVDSMNYIVKGF